MSFARLEGYRIDPYSADDVCRQLNCTFIVLETFMTLEEFAQYLEDLSDEATDYWYCRIDPHGYQSPDKSASCTFGFLSEIDAMAFKLRWA